MFCKNCGKEIKDGTKFCEFCGAEQENVQPIEQGSTVVGTKKKSKKKIFIIIGVILAIIIIWAACGNKSSKKENNQIEITTEMSKYTKTNSYGISCNGNSDLAIEAANVFANKYGGSGHDWTLTSVDASVTGMKGTYRYQYNWAGNSYTATTTFEITDYGSYRNYKWSGDFADLFYGN